LNPSRAPFNINMDHQRFPPSSPVRQSWPRV
jgi:hypothetical protein